MELGCNFQCRYCYQKPIREVGLPREWDINAVKDTVKRLYNQRKSLIVLHGGEPLILPRDVIEDLLRFSFELSGRSSIQTNGYLIDDYFIDLFKKYKTSVGLSVDGFYPCNEFRGFGNRVKRKEITERIFSNIENLVDEKIPVSIISVISRANGIRKRRELMKDFIEWCNDRRITGRLNPCTTGDLSVDLTVDEAIDFYSDMFDYMIDKGIPLWSPFKDIYNSLRGEGEVVCVFRGCDPLCTPSAISVLYDGSVGVCVRLYHDGKMYLRHEPYNDFREKVLRESIYDCKGCVWFEYCKGGCCGTSIDFDWRRKDRWCLVWKYLFAKVNSLIKSLGLKTKTVCVPQTSKVEGIGHTDGIEHIDGNIRHLDSFLLSSHNDGIEHIDNGVRHLDSGD